MHAAYNQAHEYVELYNPSFKHAGYTTHRKLIRN